MRVIVVGGGAAGFFGAIAAAENGNNVTILEASPSVLSKVRISGGGRCNVTHHCFEPRELVKAYPRGGKALRGPFSKFQPADTISWFDARGVKTKTEADGRMFPTTDDSATIVDCLQKAALQANVSLRTKTKVTAITRAESQFSISASGGETLLADRLLMATGGGRGGFELLRDLSHRIVPPVPSLFTFNVSDVRIDGLPGVAVENADLQLLTSTKTFKQSGPLLVTHWGLSGPAVLKLSSWAARQLHNSGYSATLRVNWLPAWRAEQVREKLNAERQSNAKRLVESTSPFELPKRLWKSFVDYAAADSERWAEVSKQSIEILTQQLVSGEYSVTGKGQFKEEFVTCGGVDLDEVDFRTMESRIVPGLFFAGEVLNIDGITGGFNFQNAWTTAWIAGNSMA